jgi:CMP-N-acetylneuraminic acid synthetase
MKISAIIPVKSTSSRITSKNIRLLSNKPLFIHTLEKLLNIKEINDVWIDTDDIKIVEMAHDYGLTKFKYFIRNKKFADNRTDGNKLLENEINNIESDIYLQILVTSPFTKKESIINTINILKKKEYNSVVGCFREKFYKWKNQKPLYDINNIPNSNDLEDTMIESMSLYGITKEEFLKNKKRIGTKPYLLELTGDEKIDINYQSDFDLANKIANYNKSQEQQIFNNLKVNFNSSIINDILIEMGYKNRVIKHLNLNIKNKKLFGRVRPIQIRPLKKDENFKNIYKCLESYNSMTPGDIIFVNNLLEQKAYFGDLNATIALSKGIQGTIVNGYTRDIKKITELDYPIFYSNNTCEDVKYVGSLDYYDKPIKINDIDIFVNNLIFADIDGIVIIPREIEQELIYKCKNLIENENKLSNSILFGIKLENILDNHGFF